MVGLRGALLILLAVLHVSVGHKSYHGDTSVRTRDESGSSGLKPHRSKKAKHAGHSHHKRTPSGNDETANVRGGNAKR